MCRFGSIRLLWQEYALIIIVSPRDVEVLVRVELVELEHVHHTGPVHRFVEAV